MAISREKKASKAQGKALPLHEWSGTIWHIIVMGEERRKAQTREGGFKEWKIARLWVINQLRTTKGVIYAEVSHVEKTDKGKTEDVAIIKFIPTHFGQWTQTVRKRPWFHGDTYH